MVKCEKCSKESISIFEEKEYDLHHIIPRGIGGTDLDGRVWLCKKCHDILHKKLQNVFWEFVVEKELCKNRIKEFTEGYLRKKWVKLNDRDTKPATK